MEKKRKKKEKWKKPRGSKNQKKQKAWLHNNQNYTYFDCYVVGI